VLRTIRDLIERRGAGPTPVSLVIAIGWQAPGLNAALA